MSKKTQKTPEEYKKVRKERIKKVMHALRERLTSLEEFISQAKTRRKMIEMMDNCDK